MKRLTLKQRREMPYKDYLQTDYWKTVRGFVLERDGHRCRLCGRVREEGVILHIHHSTYEHRGDEMNHPDDLITLCEDCHKNYHKLRSVREILDENNCLRHRNYYLQSRLEADDKYELERTVDCLLQENAFLRKQLKKQEKEHLFILRTETEQSFTNRLDDWDDVF